MCRFFPFFEVLLVFLPSPCAGDKFFEKFSFFSREAAKHCHLPTTNKRIHYCLSFYIHVFIIIIMNIEIFSTGNYYYSNINQRYWSTWVFSPHPPHEPVLTVQVHCLQVADISPMDYNKKKIPNKLTFYLRVHGHYLLGTRTFTLILIISFIITNLFMLYNFPFPTHLFFYFKFFWYNTH